MTIGFRNIPGNLRVPGTYLEFSPNQAGAQQPLRALIIGQAAPGSDLAAPGAVNLPSISLGVPDVRARAGAASMLAAMVADYRAEDTFSELHLLPVADDPAAVAATGSIALAGTVTIAGTLPVYVGGQSVPVLATVGMTAAQLAAAAAAACAQVATLPATATATTGTLAFTAANKGAAGNDIDLRLAYRGTAGGEAIPAGITATITPMSGGTTNPNLTTALLNLADLPFEVIVCPFTDSASLDALRSFMDENTGRWSSARKIYGHVYAAKVANLSAATTFGTGRNDKHLSVLPINGSPMPPPQIAARLGARVMASVLADPAIPMQYLNTGIQAPPPQSRFVLSDRNVLLFDGLSTYRVQQGGVVQIERLVTMNQLNDAGVPDTAYLNAETMHTLGFVARDLDIFLTTRFARVKLVADGVPIPGGSAMVSPSVIKATLDTRYRYLQDVPQVVQNADVFAKNSRVELAGGGRVNIYAPVQLVGQLRIMAVQVAFSTPT